MHRAQVASADTIPCIDFSVQMPARESGHSYYGALRSEAPLLIPEARVQCLFFQGIRWIHRDLAADPQNRPIAQAREKQIIQRCQLFLVKGVATIENHIAVGGEWIGLDQQRNMI